MAGTHDHEHGGQQDVPREDGHAPHGHARCAHAENRGDEVDAAQNGAEALKRKSEQPQVSPDPRAEGRVVEWRVREPPKGRRALRGDEPGHRNQRAEQEEPERERIESGERHVRGPQLKRDQHVGESDEQRCSEHQQHERAVHGEELVVLLLGLQNLQTGLEKFGANQQRHHAAYAEEHEGRDQIHVSDGLVVGRGEPADDHAAFGARYCGYLCAATAFGCRVFVDGHDMS